MARTKETVTKDIKPVRELIRLTDEFEILNLCKSITHLKLDPMCHMDRAYAKKWYEDHYLTGIHVRYVMKPRLSINHVADGVVYRAFNCTDAIAERIMKENPVYKSYFEDLGPIEPQEDVPTVLPADPEPEQTPETEAPEEEKPVEPETPADPEPEASVETTPEALVDEIMKELE